MAFSSAKTDVLNKFLPEPQVTRGERRKSIYFMLGSRTSLVEIIL